MKATTVVCGLAIAALAAGSAARANDQIKLPPEVTPKLRAACESDVRRLCIRDNSTVDSVKSCVMSKFLQLGSRCKFEIAQAGLTP